MTEKLSEKEIENFDVEQTEHYPVMPLRNTVLFPQQVIRYILAEIEVLSL